MNDERRNVLIGNNDHRRGESALVEKIGQGIEQPIAQHDLMFESRRMYGQCARREQRLDLAHYLRNGFVRRVELHRERVVQRTASMQQSIEPFGRVIACQQWAIVGQIANLPYAIEQFICAGTQADYKSITLERGAVVWVEGCAAAAGG